MLPSVNILRINSNAGTTPASATGIAAIIAPCSGGSAITNIATAWNSPTLVQATCLAGPLVEIPAYEMTVTNKPVVLVKPTTSTAATYSAVTTVKDGSSTFTPVTGAATYIADDYNSVVASAVSSPIPQGCAGVVVYFVGLIP